MNVALRKSPKTALSDLTAKEGSALVRAKKVLPREWVASCQAAIAEREDKVRAWEFLDGGHALEAATDLATADWSTWKPVPYLAGVPIGVKDVYNTMYGPTKMGSGLWDGFHAGNDARPVWSAKIAGAVVVGKTVTAEFAVHDPGKTVNPQSRQHIAGTSSSGSAVAVVSGMVPFAFGTQTAGSIIRPASYNGVIGFKPSFGLIPRTGVLKTADTLDTMGWFARTVDDIELGLDALRIRGRDYPIIERGIARSVARRSPGAKWRVALAMPLTWDGAKAYARDAVVEFARQLGNNPDVTVEELDLRQKFADAHPTHQTIYHKSLAYYFQKELDAGGERISPIFRSITDEGRAISQEAFVDALEQQRQIKSRFDQAIEPFDAFITLSVAGQAPTIAEGAEPPDSCLIWTLCHAPAISLPMFKGPEALPFGLQMVGRRYGDYQLLELARRVYPGEVPIVLPVA